jgi:cold shock CspA family protein
MIVPAAMPERHTGTIVTWKSEKHFGFLRPDFPGDDLFFHGTSCVAVAPAVGLRVSYSIGRHNGKLRAEAIRAEV